MEMFDAFLVRAILAGVALSLAAAPLGCFVVWRRMAYFGDATAHASILGVALSLAFALPVFIGVLLIALAMALAISALQARGQTLDTLLGVMAHSTLALGLVTVSFFSDVRIDLMAYLFGDILSVAWSDFLWIGLGLFLVVGLLGWRWSALLTCTLNRDFCAAGPRSNIRYVTWGDGAFNVGFGLGDGVVFLGCADRSDGLSFRGYSIGCLVRFSVDRPWSFPRGRVAWVALVGLADLHFEPRFGAG